MKERLQKIIARSGAGSRRKAEELMRHGRVTVNGEVVTRLGSMADPAHDVITVDDMELAPPENKIYLLLHKPPGCVTSTRDPEGRRTVEDLYDDIPERLYPVGRLDYDTEGLLVITNDGAFSQLLQHPSHGIEKKYLVKVRGIPAEASLKRLRDGVIIDGRKTSRAGVRLVKKSAKSAWCEVVLREGLNRQLKKMFELIGHPSVRIIRTAVGPLQLDRQPSGTYRFLMKSEIEAVRQCASRAAQAAKPGSPARSRRTRGRTQPAARSVSFRRPGHSR